MSISRERLEEFEALRTKLDVSFDTVSSLVDSWLPPPDPEDEAKEEKNELERQKELTKSIQERHAARIGTSGIKNKAVSEMTLLRKLTQKNSQNDGEDDPMTQNNLKRTNKNEGEDLEDSKTSIASLCLKVDSSSNSLQGDFLSMYLAERDKKKKKRNQRIKKRKVS